MTARPYAGPTGPTGTADRHTGGEPLRPAQPARVEKG
jgi:hypothetical protein